MSKRVLVDRAFRQRSDEIIGNSVYWVHQCLIPSYLFPHSQHSTKTVNPSALMSRWLFGNPFTVWEIAHNSIIILCISSLVEIGCWTDLVRYCVYRIEEFMDETLLENLDEESAVIHWVVCSDFELPCWRCLWSGKLGEYGFRSVIKVVLILRKLVLIRLA